MKLMTECIRYGFSLIGEQGRREARAVNLIMLLTGIGMFIVGMYRADWLAFRYSAIFSIWSIYLSRILDRAKWPEGRKQK